MIRHSLIALALTLGLGWVIAAAAADDNALELSIVSEKEITVRNERGEQELRRVPPTQVVPGDEVIYTLRYRNKGSTPAENVVITNPIPAHMSYSDGSARGGETHINYSTDGGLSFAAPEALTVIAADGKSRPATAADYTHIRWTFVAPIAPGEHGAVGYRARVQ